MVAKISEITRNTKKGYKFDTAHAKISVTLTIATTSTAADDMIVVKPYLLPLSKEEIKNLGMLLGLSHTTVMNDYEDSSVDKYLGSILSAWFKKQDNVMKKG